MDPAVPTVRVVDRRDHDGANGAIDGLSFAATPSEFFALLGHPAAGRTIAGRGR